MPNFLSFAIICLLLLTQNQMSDGLACYSCLNCNDPFNSLYVQVVYINDTLGYSCSKTTSAYNTSRSIIPACSTYGVVGSGQWCCQTNLCNGAQRNLLTNAFSFGIALLLFTSLF